jgi:hypothetical protein
MRNYRSAIFLYVCLLALFLVTQNTSAHPQNPRPVPAQSLRTLLKIDQQLTPTAKRRYSSALANWVALAHSVLDPPRTGPEDDGDGLKPLLDASPLSGPRPAVRVAPSVPISISGLQAAGASVLSAPGRVSSSLLDFRFSRYSGFTKNVSSSAWCGRNVVTGFQSSLAVLLTSIVRTNQDPNLFQFSASNVSVAYSSNDGESFTDLIFLNPGPDSSQNVLIGNPSLACADASTFYYATSPAFFAPDPNSPRVGVGLSASFDGGVHWADPAAAVSKDAFNHIIDTGRLAIDPRAPKRFYLTYLDIDTEGLDGVPGARCPIIRQAIELVSSIDGGHTWSSPVVVHEDCLQVDPVLINNSPFAPQVAVGRDGRVYVAFTEFDTSGDVSAHVRASADFGQSFGAERVVSDVVLTGASQGGDRMQGDDILNPVLTLALDSSRPGRETVYLAWQDGRVNPQPDVVGGTYNFSGILLAKSSDNGATWTLPKEVSPTPPDFPGLGRDQFQPAAAVSQDGTLAVCYYDRREDPQNNAVDHFCSLSRDQGRSFHDLRQTAQSWPPIHFVDLLVFGDARTLGFYDTLAPHIASQGEQGFFTSYQVIENAVTSVQARRISSAQ